jgi:phenylpropionate dioxygenase-like ring-hydroxylating dioxygenase large terminal subunit
MRHAIFTDGFFAGMESSIGNIDQSETLPPECYTDPAFFEFEKEAIFSHEWLCVGREAWVKEPGDYFTTSHIGEPLVIARTQAGELKALSTVCRHRAMQVAEGFGNTRAFLCPYHHWSYGLDGRLLGAPAMERACDFAAKDVRLPELRLEIWQGFIFVNFDLAAPPLAPRLEHLSKALAPYDLATAEGPTRAEVSKAPWIQTYPWNWKVQFENSNDGYHANRLHRGPIHDVCPSNLASFPEMPDGAAGYLRYNGTIHPDAGFNATRKAVLPIFPGLGDEDRRRFAFINIPPTFFMFARVDYVSYTLFRADGHEQTSAERGWLVAPGATREPLFRERLDMTLAGSATIGQQDRHVDAMVQAGLRSRFAPRGRYSWQEGSQSALNRWLVARYRACWTKGGGATGN